LILSLSTVRRTMADTIRIPPELAMESRGDRFPAPIYREYSMIHPNVN